MDISWNHRAAQALILVSLFFSSLVSVKAQDYPTGNAADQGSAYPGNNSAPLPQGYPTGDAPVQGPAYPVNNSAPLPQGYPTGDAAGQGSTTFPGNDSAPLPQGYPGGNTESSGYSPEGYANYNSSPRAYNGASGPAPFSSPFQFSPNTQQQESSAYENYQQNFCRPQPGWLYPQQQSATLPSGITLPITLDTTIAPETAKKGDYIQAHIPQNITLGGPNYLPGGTVVTGEVVPPDFGKRDDRKVERTKNMTILFDQFRLPNGTLIPLQAHLVGDIDNYKPKGNEANKPEGLGARLLNFGLRTTLGNGMGTAFGAGLGGISQGRYGVGSGAYYGMATGSASGALYGMLQHRGRNGVLIHAGTQMQMQIEQPVQIPSTQHGGPRRQGTF